MGFVLFGFCQQWILFLWGFVLVLRICFDFFLTFLVCGVFLDFDLFPSV